MACENQLSRDEGKPKANRTTVLQTRVVRWVGVVLAQPRGRAQQRRRRRPYEKEVLLYEAAKTTWDGIRGRDEGQRKAKHSNHAFSRSCARATYVGDYKQTILRKVAHSLADHA